MNENSQKSQRHLVVVIFIQIYPIYISDVLGKYVNPSY